MPVRILIVEDDTTLREFIADALQDAGYQVTHVASGEVALDVLESVSSFDAAYSVVITDIVMGQVDGMAVLHAAMQSFFKPSVIILTGRGTLKTAIESVRAGAFDYLLKPCLLEHMLQRVADAIDQHREEIRRMHAVGMLHNIATLASHALEQPDIVPEEPTHHIPQTDGERYRHVGRLSIDTFRHEVFFDNSPVNMTRTEYMIMSCLSETPERVVPFSSITKLSHGKELDREDARYLLAPHMRNLRAKIDRRYLVSVPGVGYMLIPPTDHTS